MGWGGLANGTLLKRAEQEFDVFLKGDRNLTFQQETRRFNIAIVVLHAATTQLRDTQPWRRKCWRFWRPFRAVKWLVSTPEPGRHPWISARITFYRQDA